MHVWVLENSAREGAWWRLAEIRDGSGKGWEVGKKTASWFTTGEGSITHGGVHTGAAMLTVTPGD